MKIMIVPFQTASERVTHHTHKVDALVIVSELWLEWCMFKKCYVAPGQYPLCSLLSQTKPPGASKLTVNASGFPGIQVLHISKILKLMGASYDEKFTQTTSTLICKDGSDSGHKLSYARMWQVPAVSESWLWSCLRNQRMTTFEKHLVRKLGGYNTGKMNAQSPSKDSHHQQTSEGRRPGSDFLVHDDSGREVVPNRELSKRDSNSTKVSECLALGNAPLREITANSPGRKPGESEPKPKKRLFRSLDGPSDETQDREMSNNYPSLQKAREKQSDATDPSTNNGNIAGEIRDFYNMKANAKASNNAVPRDMAKKTRLQGRALSNLSNTSTASKDRQSRASSVDTINTDGVGSEIVPLPSGNRKSQDLSEARSFTGRAKSRLVEGTGPSIELGDPGLYTDEFVVEETVPQMTQLLYDDPEDTIALREKLAAKRRQRSRLGQKEDDPKPGETKEPRRIRDSEIIANAGWGAGRRTRNKDKSPPGLKGF